MGLCCQLIGNTPSSQDMAACCYKKTEDHECDNNTEWMTKLPTQLHHRHLSELAIPGSHDSFAYDLDKTAPLAPDVTGSVIDKVASVFQRIAKNVIWKWSLTQRLTFTEQLEAGIRYFDLRVATRPDTPDDEDGIDDLYLVHGLFGPRLENALKDIQQFLIQHPKEVVLLDFNHFYRMDVGAHKKCVGLLKTLFADRLCPCDTEVLTLDWLWANAFQVIAFYHRNPELKSSLPQDMTELLWDGCYIPSPWHNVSDKESLIKSLDELHCTNTQGYQNPKLLNQHKHFHVTQGVLTPNAKLIVSRAGSSLKKHCGKAAAEPFVQWLTSKEAGGMGINICIMDFVEMEGFIDTVIQMNYKLLKKDVEQEEECNGASTSHVHINS